MGWTGTFGYWHNKETNLDIFKRLYNTSLEREIEEGKVKACQRGSSIYILFPTKAGKYWICKYLCQRNKRNNEFLTKDIDAIYNRCFDFPKSWLKYLDSNDEEVGKYLAERAVFECKKNVSKIKIGNTLECVAPYDIEWSDGSVIKKNEKFFVNVKLHNLYVKKRTKDYVIAQQVVNVKGEKTFINTYHRISNKTFKNVIKTVIG